MAYEPPPLPRKPASYSPSLLARQDASFFESTPAVHSLTASSDYEFFDEYDRDFSLDFQAAQRSSRPSSSGSAYGRPLPSPPGRLDDAHARVSPPYVMPDPDIYSGYEDHHLQQSPRDQYGQRERLSTSRSQSSLNNFRPLPKPPARHINPLAMSMPLPSPPSSRRHDSEDWRFASQLNASGHDSLQSPGHAPLNPFQNLSLDDDQEDEHQRNTTSHRNSSTSYVATEYQQPWSQDTMQNETLPARRGSVHSTSLLEDAEWNQARYARELYADTYDTYNTHSRHTSHEVASLSIPLPSAKGYGHGTYLQNNDYPRLPIPDSGGYIPMPDHRRRTSEASYNSMDSPVHEYFEDLYSQVDPFSAHNESDSSALYGQRRDHSAVPESSSPQDSIAFPATTSRIFKQRPPIPQIPALLRNQTLPLLIPSTTDLASETQRHVKRSSTATAPLRLHVSKSPSLPLSSRDRATTIALPVKITGRRILSSSEYEACLEPWSRLQIHSWLRSLSLQTAEAVVDSCVGLFCHTVPTLSIPSARKISTDLLQSYLACGDIYHLPNDNSASIAFTQNDVGQGILPLLTNKGCYSPRCHDNASALRCYSARCTRTIPVKLLPRNAQSSIDQHDWVQFWDLRAENEPLLSLESREVQRQYQIHEVIYSETDYLGDLKTLRDVFSTSYSVVNESDKKLVDLVFGQLPQLIALSEQQLLPALTDRQVAQGPVVQSIGDIFQHWITLSRASYIEYASKLKYADRAVRAQRNRNPRVKEWLLRCEQDTRLKKLDLSSFQGAPTRRMQRYALLLGDVLKRTSPEFPDHDTLKQAIDMIKSVCQECDAQVKIASDKIALMELADQLIWKIPQKDLGLSDPSRELLYRGELQRKSETLTSWQMRDVLLLDNYLICLKSKEAGRNVISRPPIPIDYLIVEDYTEILYKSSSTKLIGGTITHAFSPGDGNGRRPTTDSTRTTITSDQPSSPGKSTSENIYPFTVRHAGRPAEKMTLYAENSSSRSCWVSSILDAKARRWSKVCVKEPFEVKIVTDQAFGRFSGPSGPPSRALCRPTNAVEAALATQTQSNSKPICMSRVQCSSLFKGANRKEIFLVGTDDGVYANHTGPWTKLVPLARVSQLAVLEDFGVLVVLADKILIAYTLDDLLSVNHQVQSSRVIRKPPQRLSGSKDVGFFEVGVLKDRLLVIYKKRENGNSVFKALEPVIGKKQEKKQLFKKNTSTDFFRDFDQFFIPADCYGMQYLRSTICIKCSRGFEIMSLDSKQPLTIPDLTGPTTTSLRARIEGARPLGTYRVQEGEFLCCFTECGLFVDKYGAVSRTHTLEWQGRPTHAVLVGDYVLAVGKDFIEVWNVEKRSLRQVITGRDVRLLPHSSAGTSIDTLNRGVLIAMDSPAAHGTQLIFELVLRR